MSIRRVFVRERSAYTVADLAAKLGINEERASECISVLTMRGVLRWRSGSERDEFDNEDPASYAGKYQFVYVGLAVFEDLVVVVYPKYMNERCFADDSLDEAICDDLRQLFLVLRKSAGSYSDIASFSEGARKFDDRIACMLMLMELYDEYGVYSNYMRMLETNGIGEVSWERTIVTHQAFIDDETPVYFDLETIASTHDDADFVMRLHRCVLTECSCYMKDTGLTQLLSLDEIELSEERLGDLGDKDYVLYRLDLERRIQFVTWKQDVLDLLIRYVNEAESDVYVEKVACLGSTSFYNVWEKACKVAFGDLLDRRLSKIGVPLVGEWSGRCNDTVLGIVPRPEWSKFVNEERQRCGDVPTLIPDIVSVWDYDDGKAFVILDAKYYTPQLGASPRGVPGVGPVTKQILYQQAYRKFVLAHGFARVVNAFLVPYEEDRFEPMGHVDFPDIFDCVEPPFVDGVDMWLISARRIWQCYLNGKMLTGGELSQLLDIPQREKFRSEQVDSR